MDGGLYYGNQQIQGQLTAATLTASYGSTNVISENIGGHVQVVLYVSATTGSAETNTNVLVKVESGPTFNSATDIYRMQTIAITSGAITLSDAEYTKSTPAAATTYAFAIPLGVADMWFKASFKDSGVSVNHTVITAKLLVSGL